VSGTAEWLGDARFDCSLSCLDSGALRLPLGNTGKASPAAPLMPLESAARCASVNGMRVSEPCDPERCIRGAFLASLPPFFPFRLPSPPSASLPRVLVLPPCRRVVSAALSAASCSSTAGMGIHFCFSWRSSVL
jgi:hypothetical protein